MVTVAANVLLLLQILDVVIAVVCCLLFSLVFLMLQVIAVVAAINVNFLVCSAAEIFLMAFFKKLLFNSLIGNGD